MEFPLHIVGCEGQNLVVKCPLGSAFQLWQKGVLLKAVKRQYTINNNAGQPIAVRFKVNFGDMAVPKVLVDGQPVEITPPLPWYDRVWIHSPLLLVFIGGAIGGMIGAAAAMINGRVYHTLSNKKLRYALAALVFVSAFAVHIFVASWIQTRFFNSTEPNTNYEGTP